MTNVVNKLDFKPDEGKGPLEADPVWWDNAFYHVNVLPLNMAQVENSYIYTSHSVSL